MAGSIADYAENKLIDHLLGKTSFTMPSVWAALVTTTPTDADTPATLDYADYTGYAPLALSGSDFNAASGGSTTNATAWVWPDCSAGSNTIAGMVLVDNATQGTGNMLAWADVASKTIDTSNTPPTIAIGAFTFSLN
jgi:hypothetical protein